VLAHTLEFWPDAGEVFFQDIPAAAAVFSLHGDGDPYVSKTANLRRRLERLLGPPTPQSKRLNLRSRVHKIQFSRTGSDFESQVLLYRLLREHFPTAYAARLRLRPAPLVKLHLQNQYPRASVTTRLGQFKASGPRQNLYYGPFASRVSAEKFAADALDFFKMRRCVDDLNPDLAFPGCVYSEMKMCLAPCYKGCTDEEYHAEVGHVQAFFDTRGDSLARELVRQRDEASANLAFEDAASIHTRLEKLKPVVTQLPETVRRIDRLDAVIVQASSEPGSVALFRFRGAQITGPMQFRVESRDELKVAEAGADRKIKPQTMESRVEQAIAAFTEPPISAAQHNEYLAIFKRWYYRSNRMGEIFFSDEKGAWPLRRIARGIGRVVKGEKPEELPMFSADQNLAQP
jgi:excinuclease UvrABC nuclease subunit